MYVVYVLKSSTRIYVGYSSNLKNRLKQHLNGNTHTTKRMQNLELVFFEAFKDKRDATKQEKFYKTGYGKEVLKDKIKNSLI